MTVSFLLSSAGDFTTKAPSPLLRLPHLSFAHLALTTNTRGFYHGGSFAISCSVSLQGTQRGQSALCLVGSLPARSPWRAIYHRGKYLDLDKLFESRSETNTAASRSTSSFQMRVWKPRRKPSLNALACSSPVQHRNRASRHRQSDTHSRRPSTPTSKATLKLRLALPPIRHSLVSPAARPFTVVPQQQPGPWTVFYPRIRQGHLPPMATWSRLGFFQVSHRCRRGPQGPRSLGGIYVHLCARPRQACRLLWHSHDCLHASICRRGRFLGRQSPPGAA